MAQVPIHNLDDIEAFVRQLKSLITDIETKQIWPYEVRYQSEIKSEFHTQIQKGEVNICLSFSQFGPTKSEKA